MRPTVMSDSSGIFFLLYLYLLHIYCSFFLLFYCTTSNNCFIFLLLVVISASLFIILRCVFVLFYYTCVYKNVCTLIVLCSNFYSKLYFYTLRGQVNGTASRPINLWHMALL